MPERPQTLAAGPDALDTVHVSGVVVHARADAAEAVAGAIAELAGAEVVTREGGKLVVVIEAPDEHGLSDTLNRISLMDDVYAAALVSHHVDEPETQGGPS